MTPRNNPSLNRKEVDAMTEKELMTMLIDSYRDLQRILIADDPKKEAENQMTIVKAKLEALGIVTENLDIR